jgi:hypothetical protein
MGVFEENRTAHWVRGVLGRSPDTSCGIDSGTPNFRADPSLTPLSYLLKLFNDEFRCAVLEETNKYAQSQNPTSHGAKWEDVTDEELLRFLGCAAFMGLERLSRRGLYWTETEWIGSGRLKHFMSCNRFNMIARHLHFATFDEDAPKFGHANHDKSHQFRDIVVIFFKNCREVWIVGPNLSGDEAIIAAKVRSALKVFTQGKPEPWGIKVWCLNDQSTGFCFAAFVYDGRAPDGSSGKNLGLKVIMALTEHVPPNRIIYCDRLFTSVDLAVRLAAERSLFMCGTANQLWKTFPKMLVPHHQRNKKDRADHTIPRHVSLTRGNSDCCTATYKVNGKCVPVIAVRWVDTKDVYFISTAHTGREAREAYERRLDRQDAERTKLRGPDVAVAYNNRMGAVDRYDGLRAMHTVDLHMKNKYYHKIFWWLFETALVNAYIMWNSHHPKKTMTQWEYRMAVVDELLKEPARVAGPQRFLPIAQGQSHLIVTREDFANMLGKHYQDIILPSRPDCAHCLRSSETKRCRPATYCMTCRVPICVAKFREYHEREHAEAKRKALET